MRHLTGLALVVFLAGCSPGAPPPVQSGEVLRYEAGRVVQRWPLTSEERFSVSAWLRSHDSGWSLSAVDYAPVLYVRLHHEDGTDTSLNLMDTTFVVEVHAGWEYSQNFSPRDVDTLRHALTTSATANNRWRGP